MEIFDMIIIGGGPAGITAAIYASRTSLKTLWLDAGFTSGGQIADSARVDNFPGFPMISGAQLGEKMALHAEGLGMVSVKERVRSVEKLNASENTTSDEGPGEAGNTPSDEGKDGSENKPVYFDVITKKNRYRGRTIIYAGGAVHRKMGIPGEEELDGSGVSYCATCDGAFFKGMDTAVVGGGNTACEEALFLAGLCRRVFLIHRRRELRADAVLQNAVRKTENIELVLEYIPEEVIGDMKVDGLKIQSTAGDQQKVLPVQGVFAAIGMLPNTDPVRHLVETDETGYILAGEDCITSCPGIFAAGDVRKKALRQVITAASDGACAVHSVQRYLNQRAGDVPVFFQK